MSLAKTYLQDIRVKFPSNLDSHENRVTQTGLLTAALAMTKSPASIVSADLLEKAEKSNGLNLDVPVMKKGVVTISNVRSCTISGGRSETDLVRITFKTVRADILLVPSEYEKNQVKYLQDLAKHLREIAEAFKVEIETDLDTALDAAKSQVYGSAIVGTTYAFTGGAIQVPESRQKRFFNDLQAINFADDFYEPRSKVISSHTIMPTVSWYINQGKDNAENTSFQFADKDFTFSNRVDVDGDAFGTGYWMPDGSLGFITRIDPDARLAHKAGDGTEWMEDTIPGLPFPVGIMFKSKCDDKSALEEAGLAHLTATLVNQWQISFDYAIVTPYNSDNTTKPSPIRKFEFVADETP